MSEKLKECIPILQVLVSAKKPSVRKAYLNLFHHCILSAMREICVNLLMGNIDLTDVEKAKLRRYKKALRKLADPQTPVRTKKNLLQGRNNNVVAQLLPLVLRRLKNV